MYPRVEYEMTEADLAEILKASAPTMAIMIGSFSPPSPQENANRAWQALGRKMGFDWQTVRPGKAARFFTAVPSETEAARAERVARENAAARKQRVQELNAEIAVCQAELEKLNGLDDPPAARKDVTDG